jgi:predicted CXXCH cytochrome family protein
VAPQGRPNIINPAKLDYVHANDVCIQCHSQGQPLTNRIGGKYYDWPVGFQVGKNLSDFWKLEEHKLGVQSFTHFADGTAHKNRMQGNDFVQSLMYTRGVTCFSCHDVHGTPNQAVLWEPATNICLDCHGPNAAIGPHAPTIEAHTHHKPDSPGSECIACHRRRSVLLDRKWANSRSAKQVMHSIQVSKTNLNVKLLRFLFILRFKGKRQLRAGLAFRVEFITSIRAEPRLHLPKHNKILLPCAMDFYGDC